MAKYLLIESRDPFDSADVGQMYQLTEDLADHGSAVAVFLVQNGVLPARRTSRRAEDVTRLASKATVLADEFSMRERRIRPDELADGVTSASVDTLVDLIVDEDRKVMWH